MDTIQTAMRDSALNVCQFLAAALFDHLNDVQVRPDLVRGSSRLARSDRSVEMFQDGFRVRRKAVDGKQDSLDATRRRAERLDRFGSLSNTD